MDVGPIIRASIALQGGGEMRDFEFGPTVCAKCAAILPVNGQVCLRAAATRLGIYFHCKIPCPRCKRRLGFVRVAPELPDEGA